ncbi:TolC family protein [Sulfurimonas autotrophica]|uniref:Outer membrane efflux protein n=1 Tax=Sulfurimonas autotrophica (strain ATCC BAA-671 / DSM 16294 / JCM 11897 / OK10) TaxID=563040 RepID=E0UTT5_SULAO|nr:TolC family protein [Sulfurimonas autotrophica]ADN09379.1 outer membrane efflux protein [Sulfurimonas autotrophica DSM 16294]
MKKIVGIFAFSLLLHASTSTTNTLTLDQALQLLKTKNLEIKAAKFDELSAKEDIDAISGKNWGKLTFTQDIARSNDAGNVFGFKLASREAVFRDFGFAQFGSINIDTPPDDLNYPGYKSFFQSKLKYEVPLFTGFMLSSYTDIMKKMQEMKSLDKSKIKTQKEYELKKSFYDMALLDSSIKNLNRILDNINILENTTKTMIDVGYAKKVDLLEVKAKKGNVERLLVQMNSNKKLLYHYISFLLNQKVDHIQTPAAEVAMPGMSDEEILDHNVDLKKAATGLKITKDMLSASQAAYYPTLGAFGEMSTADDTFLGDADKHKAYTIGARLSWNLFDGGIDAAKIEKSKIQKLKMRSQVELAKKGILLKIAKIRTEIEGVDVEIASLKKELDLANAIYENYEGRYKEKLVSMSDVIIKQSAQIEKILQLQIAQNKRTEKILALEKLANGEN